MIKYIYEFYIRFLRLTELWITTGEQRVKLPTVWAQIAFCGLLRSFSFWRCFMKKIGIIMGSDSDLPIIQKAVDVLKAFDVPYEVHIYSAHRTPV